MKMNNPPAFQLYTDDFLGGTADMTAEEVGAYIRLLCHQWNKGFIPNDDVRLMTMAGLTQALPLGFVKSKFDEQEPGILRNARLELVRAAQMQFREKQRINGAKGGRKTKLRNPDVTQANPNSNPTAKPNESSPYSVLRTPKGEGEGALAHQPIRITGKGELGLTEGQTNHTGRHNTEIEAPSWEEFWKFCQHIGMHGESYALDKFHAADQKHWQNAPNWSAYASRVKAWWEQDGKPMTSPKGNGAPAVKVFPETQLKVIEAALLEFPCNPKSTKNLMGKTYPPEMVEKYKAMKKKRDELRDKIASA